ncbi:class I SAM-dependent methyltransferase [Bacillus safensis]|uniref:class I SAM-dependent methyltransferase n=1 Tax=Bacillus safensis TaxID=561879 RepID=UPI002150CB2E|nr:class I SAM-dependent methyltransferase [Bacillus safensis]MCR6473754.1 class I SAM-dependent methyltransferase [Bacillus safensis]MEE3679328.1 class I SAM-dependent methyltransferase [Bacillus safensis]WHX75975.1 class I SAM-dependent methyltransferase [Bacillus safensis]WHX83434.1 class I SAM-dependent methyltransferase [Bacillus safensis]
MLKTTKDLKKMYPWLNINTTVEEYVEASYYNRILKEYIFNNKTDLEYFKDWFSNNFHKNSSVLELGCGTGRVSELALELASDSHSLTLLDLSNQMLNFTQDKFKNHNHINYINSDSIDFLWETKKTYDLVYSLWSFSHSIHQILTANGFNKGKEYVQGGLNKFLKENLKRESSFFLIHFDSQSSEQKILINQWKKVFPIFDNHNQQSPSKLLIDEELNKLKEERVIDFTSSHFIGKPIVYASENEALETFMNFHMESYFNESELVLDIISELKNYFKNYTNDLGEISIPPGCFIYNIKRI